MNTILRRAMSSRSVLGAALVGAGVLAGAASLQPAGSAEPTAPAGPVVHDQDGERGLAAAPADPGPAPARYEAVFFEALNARPELREGALAEVRRRVVEAPGDARAVLLLGVGHLWCAAERPRSRAEAVEHLVLARHYLERAGRLNPADDRIPSWLLSAEIGLAESEGRDADAAAALAELREHARRDPCFHSVAYAISVWDGARDRAELAEAQRLLEAAAACNPEDPSVRNLARWPHNVEGFLVGLSDVALKRGDRDRAMACLVAAEAWPGAERWPHLAEVQTRRRDFAERAARFADDDPANDPPFIFERGGPASCVSCHRAGP